MLTFFPIHIAQSELVATLLNEEEFITQTFLFNMADLKKIWQSKQTVGWIIIPSFDLVL